jgi:uncharacterized protein (DUF1501 family)
LLIGLAPEHRVGANRGSVFAVGPVTPLVVRGPAPVLSWSPRRILPASDDTMMRLLALYRHTDPHFARAIEERERLAAIAPADKIAEMPTGPISGPNINRLRDYFTDAVGTAAKFLALPDGPRVGALALDGWDTHYNEGIATGQLAQLLGALDGALAAAQDNMGPAWRETVVVLVTEFGRTARINGTAGTDHGTATVMLLAGGALKGGRVVADWPGLKPANLLDNRDLRPTTDMRGVLKGLLRDHLRADEHALAMDVFPGSNDVKPIADLVVSA